MLQKSEGFVSESKDSHISEVEIKIQEERDKIAQHMEKLSGEQLLNPDTDPADAQKIILKIKKDFDDTVGKLTRYRQYQETLDMVPVEIKELNDFQKKYDVRYKLWNNLKNFREKSNLWLTKAFRDQDAEEIVTQVKEFDRDNLFLRQQIGRDNNDLVLE